MAQIIKLLHETQRFNNHGLTGCLNFFNSSFEGDIINIFDPKCEDGLNIVNSSGDLDSINV